MTNSLNIGWNFSPPKIKRLWATSFLAKHRSTKLQKIRNAHVVFFVFIFFLYILILKTVVKKITYIKDIQSDKSSLDINIISYSI